MPNNFDIQIITSESDKTLTNKIVKAIIGELNEAAKKMAASVESELRRLFEARISHSKTWKSLLAGTLVAEFGLFDPDDRLEEIMRHWIQQITVKYTPFKRLGTDIVGGLTIHMIDFSFQSVKRLPAAIVHSKGGDVEWLKWLLFAGNRIIVADYRIVYGVFGRPNPSRSGQAVMIKSTNDPWRVPMEHAGTPGDNFVTRALSHFGTDIKVVVERHFKRTLV